MYIGLDTILIHYILYDIIRVASFFFTEWFDIRNQNRDL